MQLTLQAFIDIFTAEAEDRGIGFWVYRGGTFTDGLGLAEYIPAGFEFIDHWSDVPGRIVWVNDRNMSIITYTDGDVVVSRHAQEVTLLDELEEGANFYGGELRPLFRILSLLAWIRAAGRGPGAVLKRGARVAAHRTINRRVR